MSHSAAEGAGPLGPAPAQSAVTDRIDAQILANWTALRRNPDLDAAHVMQVIDRLLDERAIRTKARTRMDEAAER